jgi:hypothetical protein
VRLLLIDKSSDCTVALGQVRRDILEAQILRFTMKPAEFSFFRGFLGKFSETQFLLNQIDSVTCDRIRSWTTKREAKDYAEQLFRHRVVNVPEFGLRLQLKALREMDGKEFDHIEILFRRSRRRRGKKCFVGHRFSPIVENTLRWNLQQVLEPYGIELDWSGRDMASVQILEDIVRKINVADFCVFDNRATLGRPNVYIEAGMCIVLKKPFILFEYAPGPKDPNDPGSIPSDLGFALSLRYRNYRELFQDFYSRLPVFFEENIH